MRQYGHRRRESRGLGSNCNSIISPWVAASVLFLLMQSSHAYHSYSRGRSHSMGRAFSQSTPSRNEVVAPHHTWRNSRAKGSTPPWARFATGSNNDETNNDETNNDETPFASTRRRRGITATTGSRGDRSSLASSTSLPRLQMMSVHRDNLKNSRIGGSGTIDKRHDSSTAAHMWDDGTLLATALHHGPEVLGWAFAAACFMQTKSTDRSTASTERSPLPLDTTSRTKDATATSWASAFRETSNAVNGAASTVSGWYGNESSESKIKERDGTLSTYDFIQAITTVVPIPPPLETRRATSSTSTPPLPPKVFIPASTSASEAAALLSNRFVPQPVDESVTEFGSNEADDAWTTTVVSSQSDFQRLAQTPPEPKTIQSFYPYGTPTPTPTVNEASQSEVPRTVSFSPSNGYRGGSSSYLDSLVVPSGSLDSVEVDGLPELESTSDAQLSESELLANLSYLESVTSSTTSTSDSGSSYTYDNSMNGYTKAPESMKTSGTLSGGSMPSSYVAFSPSPSYATASAPSDAASSYTYDRSLNDHAAAPAPQPVKTFETLSGGAMPSTFAGFSPASSYRPVTPPPVPDPESSRSFSTASYATPAPEPAPSRPFSSTASYLDNMSTPSVSPTFSWATGNLRSEGTPAMGSSYLSAMAQAGAAPSPLDAAEPQRSTWSGSSFGTGNQYATVPQSGSYLDALATANVGTVVVTESEVPAWVSAGSVESASQSTATASGFSSPWAMDTQRGMRSNRVGSTRAFGSSSYLDGISTEPEPEVPAAWSSSSDSQSDSMNGSYLDAISRSSNLDPMAATQGQFSTSSYLDRMSPPAAPSSTENFMWAFESGPREQAPGLDAGSSYYNYGMALTKGSEDEQVNDPKQQPTWPSNTWYQNAHMGI